VADWTTGGVVPETAEKEDEGTHGVSAWRPIL